MKKQALSMILAMVMIITCLIAPAMATPADAQTSETQSEATMLQAVHQNADGEIITETAGKDTTQVEILVSVDGGETVYLQTSDLELAVAAAEDQRAGLYAAESSVESILAMDVEVEHYFSLVFNGFSFKGEAWMADAINEIEGLSAMVAPMFQLIEPEQEGSSIDLTPSMATATDMVGAVNAWDLGYTGKGMVIAVIDTGIKQTHEAFSVAPEGGRIDEAYLEEVFGKYGDLMTCKSTEGVYYSAKMPYNWDYFDHDHIPNHTANNHGSHVAGIVAGNNGTDFKGVAPDAQIISLQVFTNTGGAYTSDLLAAMEDSVYLGVDAINMSLGISNGFTSYQWPLNFEPVYKAMDNAGIAVCVAASNDQHAYISTNYFDFYTTGYGWLSSNPDNGLIGTPGTYAGSFTVGNTTNVARSDNFDFGKVKMVDSSSWGPTARLSLKPDISAPGNNIVSVDGTASSANNAYTKKTGTSMATPAVAGGMMLMKEYLKTVFPDATGSELVEKAYAMTMSTAGQASAFVRQQGAGVMDLEKAMKTKAYLTSTDDKRPKLELDDSETGEFAMSFKVTNFGTADKTYDITFTALTEQTSNLAYKGRVNKYVTEEQAKKLGFYVVNPETVNLTVISGTMKDVTNLCVLEGNKAITVKAGETVTVNLTLKAGEELMQYFQETCPAGMYLEGWVKLADKTSENTVNLSIPFLGFVGDWDYPAMFDDGWWWQDEYGVNNLSMLYGSNGNLGGTFAGYGDSAQGLGLNYYWDETGETYLADRNAISPNGDGYLDEVTTIEFSLLRQPKTVRLYVRHEDGSVTELYNNDYGFRRETFGKTTGLTFSGFYLDDDMADMEENETATYVVEAYLDHDEFKLEDNKLAKLEIPFTKDTVAPVVTAVDGGVEIRDANYVSYYAVYADGQRNEMLFEDGIFAMERGVAETYTTDLDEYFVAVADYARNEAFYYVKDGAVYEVDAEGFDHGRTIIGQTHFKQTGVMNGQENQFAWYSFSENLDQQPVRLTEITTESNDLLQKGLSSDIIGVSKAADGTIYASSLAYLYELDPLTFERKVITEYKTEGYRTTTIYGFAVAPGTNDLYGIAVYNGSPIEGWFCRIDAETGSTTKLWKVGLMQYRRSFAFYDEDTVILRNMTTRINPDLEFINISDGTVEFKENLGLCLKNGLDYLLGFYGYTQSMLYDDADNCIYFGGCWSQNREFRMTEDLILKYDLDTDKVDYMVPGSNGGIGLYALFFLDEMVPAEALECIYYRQDIAPTCDTEGYTLHTCVDCGHEYRDNFVPAVGHNYEAVVTEPTCTELGYTTYTCTVCGDSYVADYTLPCDHEFVEVVIEPTCTEAGYTIYMCECGYEVIGDVVDPIAHDYATYTVEPTCDEYGYVEHICTVCGDYYVSEYFAPVCLAEDFVDVDTKQWYHEGVCYVLRNGLMEGKGNGLFAPNANLTRAELVTVLYRMAGEPSVEGLEHPFADVAAGTWYTDAVIWAYNAEVVKGISETAFAPNANITREQIATILYRYAGAEGAEENNLKGFSDAGAVSGWAVEAMNWAVSVGLINGMDETTLAPQGNATRAQIATILMRYCEG